jgi:hypothetical protein
MRTQELESQRHKRERERARELKAKHPKGYFSNTGQPIGLSGAL